MIDMLTTKQSYIEMLCEEFGVQWLWLVGSATKGTWNPATSDLDFIVDLGTYEQGVSSRQSVVA